MAWWRWAPVFGIPRTIFASHEVEQYATESNVCLHFIAVQAPWQNGLCERAGGILKTVLAAATACWPTTWTSKIAGFHRCRLPLEGSHYLRRCAWRWTAGRDRLHGAAGLREDCGREKALSRNFRMADAPCVGDLVYCWREQRYSRKASQNRRRLTLKRWHGPALMAAQEGNNAYVTTRGTLTKVAFEHIRRASPMEQIASGEWEAVIQEVVAAAVMGDDWPSCRKCCPRG
eukprot:s3879_g8.t1